MYKYKTLRQRLVIRYSSREHSLDATKGKAKYTEMYYSVRKKNKLFSE